MACKSDSIRIIYFLASRCCCNSGVNFGVAKRARTGLRTNPLMS